jgi:hypothetical protein
MNAAKTDYPESPEPNLSYQDAGRIPGSDRRTRARDLLFSRKAALLVIGSFLILAGLAAILGLSGVIDGHVVSVALWALLGLYFAFGILVVMYRLISNLE